MSELSYSKGRRVLSIDAREFEELAKRLSPRERRKAERYGLNKACRLLISATEEEFRHLRTKHDTGRGALTGALSFRKGRLRPGKVAVRRLISRPGSEPMAIVSIAGRGADYRAKWFELGTAERYTKSRRITGRYRIGGKLRYTRAGAGGYRGSILRGDYFRRAKERTKPVIFELLREQMRGWVIRAANRKGR